VAQPVNGDMLRGIAYVLTYTHFIVGCKELIKVLLSDGFIRE
jgi:hypothetical protein